MIKITNQANLKFQMMSDNLQVGILNCRIDEYLSIEEMNDGFVQLSGYTAEDMEHCFKNRLSACIYEEDLSVFQSLQAGIAQGKIYATAEYRITGKDTEIRWYRLLALTQFDDTGKPSSAIGIIFNIDDGCDYIQGYLIGKPVPPDQFKR